ncbi:Rhs element Vgr protein [Paucimonas lemoignei]|uniref:Rhs element Vgr protein n=1 Tax=Paucimonas lemoignei TaxID=29443 RepID=A0A4R3HPY2_PAULE|nr:type VI secretion system Vgr family protein [Paucimonas lemoignei]TCS33312.1 Rhs element Vgr protein [Paucimonas lemoignei]
MSGDILGAAGALRALLAGHTQDTRLLRLTTSLGSAALVVESINGTEGISQSFRFEIIALSIDAAIDGAKLLGQPALLEVLTQHSRNEPRPFHGHVTAFESLSSDGGFTRYRIRLEPWIAFLRHRFDCFVWQDKTTLEIISEIFSDYQGQGALVADWRLALTDSSQYTPREVCTQFEESDLAFVERLLAEEGLFYWFEHTGDSTSPALGSHRLVIADSNAAFVQNQQAHIRFHRAAAVEHSDTITEWQASRRILTNTMMVSSWNERQVSVMTHQLASAHNNGEVPELMATDHSGLRHFASGDSAARAARLQLEAMEARNKTYHGESTVRTLAPGTTFVLTEHSVHDNDRRESGDDAATFAVIAVQHTGRNNLSSEAKTLIDKVFVNSVKPLGAGGQAKQASKNDVPLYHNRFTVLRADIPWRPLTTDARGALLHPKPTVTGIHTAIVVGASGQDLTTERDHRIKVQMHWQRGAQAASRRGHPNGENAPGNETAYVWVRVAEPAAGANWGSSFIPRIGQEVILDYIEGDIDRPVVVGSLYNGNGLSDAQGNQNAQGAGAATGNAPAWFAGESGEHAHNAILSGFKTQEIGNSQDGQGGYNALVFDDSTDQVGARLQTTKAKAQLNLGHIKRQTDNARQQSHGHGAELTTEAFGAVRAGQGLLLSTDARPNAGSSQLDAKEALAQLQQAHELQKSLADTAQKHNAFVGKTLDQEQHNFPEEVLKRPIESLQQTNQGCGTAEGGGAGTVPAFGRPDMVLSSPAGIALLTPADAHVTASSMTIAGGLDVSITAGRNYAVAVRSGISLFTYGDAKAKRKDQGDKGIKLHAAHGKVDLQAQSAELKAAADKDVMISSTHAKVEAAAKEHVLLTAGGAYVKIAGGKIEIHAPGSVLFKAAMKDLSGPTSMNHELATLAKGDLKMCEMQSAKAAASGGGLVAVN